MNIPNRVTLDALVRLPIGEIAALPAEELARLQQEADEALRAVKAACAWLDGALSIKYADRAEAVRRDAGKDFGTARFVDGDVTVVAELPKKVDWDQVQLSQLVERRQMIELVRAGRGPEELAKEFEPSAQAIRNWVAQPPGLGPVLRKRRAFDTLFEVDTKPGDCVGTGLDLWEPGLLRKIHYEARKALS